MNYIIKHITFLAIFLLLISCDDPSPIEIINEEEEVEISIINPEPNSYVITGYDSTGITAETPERVSVISLSGIKNTSNDVTVYKGYGEAIFFDTTKAVFNNSNRLIGFKTLDFGTVRFGGILAEKVPYVLNYRDNFNIKDTLLGTKHTISYRSVFTQQNSDFQYDRNLNIEFRNQQGNPSLMTIKIPDEIVGNVEIEGRRNTNNLKITLFWNASKIGPNSISGNISEEIIVGGVSSRRDELVPLFRLSSFNKRRFVIPNSLVEDILESNEYEYIVFTFLRKIRKSNSTSRLGDVYFASQSIHNIFVKL